MWGISRLSPWFRFEDNSFATWPVRWTLTVGGQAKAALLAACEEGGKVSDHARSMVGHELFTTATEPYKVDLAVVTVAELGFAKGGKTAHIWPRAQAYGLLLCPPEVPLYLRSAYVEQPEDEFLWVAMKHIPVPGGGQRIFGL